jgi:hypothetical protein
MKLCLAFSNIISGLYFIFSNTHNFLVLWVQLYSLFFAILLWENKLTALFAVILQEDGICLMTVIKGTSKFRRSRRHDFVSDFLPPSMTELKYVCDQIVG